MRLSGEPGAAEGRPLGIYCAIIGLHLALCALLFEPKIHTGGDSATYVLLAESVLQQGDGYSLTVDPGPPAAHVKYPPGYPVALAPLVAAFGRNFALLKLLSIGFTAASALFFCLYLRRRGSAFWIPASLAFAASPGVVDYSRWMLTEAPYLMATVVALWALAKDKARSELGIPFAIVLAASVAAFYFRLFGALLLAGIFIGYLLRRDWKRVLVFGGLGSGLTLPWLIRNRLLSGAANPYLEEFLIRNIYAPDQGMLDFGGFVERTLSNAWLYATRELPRALAGSDSAWASSLLVALLAGVVVCLALFGYARALRPKPGGGEIYLFLSCAAILLFQGSVVDVRYLVPLLPLIFVYAMDGAARLARPGGDAPWTRKLPVALASLLIALGLSAQLARAPGNLRMIDAYLAGDRYAGYAPGWRRFFEAADAAREGSPPDAVFTVRKPRLFRLLADRRAVIYPFTEDADAVLQAVRETDYVVVDAVSAQTAFYLAPAIMEAAEEFAVVHQTAEPATHTLRVVKDPPIP